MSRISGLDEIVNMHDAKTRLSKLVERVERGEEIVIARRGKPVARLIGYEERRFPVAEPGWFKGDIELPEESPELDEEIRHLFEDGPVFPDEETGEPD